MLTPNICILNQLNCWKFREPQTCFIRTCVCFEKRNVENELSLMNCIYEICTWNMKMPSWFCWWNDPFSIVVNVYDHIMIGGILFVPMCCQVKLMIIVQSESVLIWRNQAMLGTCHMVKNVILWDIKKDFNYGGTVEFGMNQRGWVAWKCCQGWVRRWRVRLLASYCIYLEKPFLNMLHWSRCGAQ